MQIIVRVTWTPEQYLISQKQSSMMRPHRCPNCSARKSLRALGYYERGLSGTNGKDLRLLVRRFRCGACKRTVSLLPDFAQPYRFVRSRTIERYFNGDVEADEVRRTTGLLRCYWRKFTTWLPKLKRVIGAHLGLSPPASQPRRWWGFLMDTRGNLASATRRLVEEVRVTVFGLYQCHQPRPS